jgi:very-short-patch-repair endonuclease
MPPKKDCHKLQIIESFCSILNNADLSQLPGTDRKQRFFLTTCKLDLWPQHVTLRSIESVYRNPDRNLRCKICEYSYTANVPFPERATASSYERAAYYTLKLMKLWFLVEVKLVRRGRDTNSALREGPQDIWVPSLDLIIQVDGEQHFKGRVFDNGYTESHERDEEFNIMCFEQGFRLLRLHHRDEGNFGWWISQAVRSCEKVPRVKFLMFSDGFRTQREPPVPYSVHNIEVVEPRPHDLQTM